MNPIIKFILDNCDGLYGQIDVPMLEKYVGGHVHYGTFQIAVDDKGIAGVCRWNWDNEETAYIITVIVRKDLRYKHVLKQLIYLGKQRFPKFKYIRFERGKKNRSEFRTLDITKILKE